MYMSEQVWLKLFLVGVSLNCYRRVCALSLQQHTDEVFVLESNPSDSSTLLSASHDGLIIIWDLRSGKAIKSFTNDVSSAYFA